MAVLTRALVGLAGLLAVAAFAGPPSVQGKTLQLGLVDAGTLPAPIVGGLVYDVLGDQLLSSDGGTWRAATSRVEVADFIPLAEGPSLGNGVHGDTTTYDGASFVTNRPVRFSSITFYVTTASGGGGIVYVCVFQRVGGQSGVATLLASSATNVTATGQTVATVTAIAAGTGCPASINPANAAGGGDATPAITDLALVARFQ